MKHDDTKKIFTALSGNDLKTVHRHYLSFPCFFTIVTISVICRLMRYRSVINALFRSENRNFYHQPLAWLRIFLFYTVNIVKHFYKSEYFHKKRICKSVFIAFFHFCKSETTFSWWLFGWWLLAVSHQLFSLGGYTSPNSQSRR